MTRLPSCGRLLSRRGICLAEWALALACVMCLVMALAGAAVYDLDAARAKRTVAEMSAILDAGQKYYAHHGVWPADIRETGLFLSAVPGGNSWGSGYRLGSSAVRLWVETDVPASAIVPAGLRSAVLVYPSGAKAGWRMSVPLSHGATARLVYEKK